ncbi:MAG: NAD-dependent epimerase/dehydratase family protein [Vulcanimicrobiota bacterium]
MQSGYSDLPVLVTGAGGFVGSHLYRRLLEEQARVSVILRPDRDYTRIGLDGAEVFRADIADHDAVMKAFRASRPRVVFHLAANLDRHRGLKGLDQLIQCNVMGTLNVLRAAASVGSEAVVYTGASEEYGRNPAPFAETQEPDPLTPYAASKATATMWCRTLHRSLGLNCMAARLFMIYGPGQPDDILIAQLLRAVNEDTPLRMTAGEQTRDFTWVGDAVEALMRLGRQRRLGGQVFNVCTGHETQVRQVVAAFEEVLGRKLPVEFGAVNYRESELFRVWGSPYSLHGAIGYRPRTTLKEGIEQLLAGAG